MQRITKQRQAVEKCLNQISGFASIQEIHSELQNSGSKVGLSTVYRLIGEMHADDQLDMILNENNESLFRLCSKDHHHHIVCTDCGIAVEIVDELIESWANKVAKMNKFKLKSHQLELTGTCINCS